jgi:hypothetical protein
MGEQGNNVKDARPLVSRRSVALGAAWSVPVVMVATAAPAAAASAGADGRATGTGSMVKGTAQNYTLTLPFILTGAAGSEVTVTITSVTTETQSGTVPFTVVPQTVTLTVGGQTSAIYALLRGGNNSGPTVTVQYSVNGVPQSPDLVIPVS